MLRPRLAVKVSTAQNASLVQVDFNPPVLGMARYKATVSEGRGLKVAPVIGFDVFFLSVRGGHRRKRVVSV